jgi:hypothetical protein
MMVLVKMKRLIKAQPEPILGTSPATALAELEDWRLRGLTGTIDSNTQGLPEHSRQLVAFGAEFVGENLFIYPFNQSFKFFHKHFANGSSIRVSFQMNFLPSHIFFLPAECALQVRFSLF